MSLFLDAAWPLLHAAPHGGDPLGIVILVLIWIVAFVGITGAVLGLLVWRYGRRAEEPADRE